MSKILGINIGHNASAALIVDGQLVYFCEEERISRVKYDGNPFRAMIQILQFTSVDHLVVCGTSNDLPKLPWTNEDPYLALTRKFSPGVKAHYYGDKHHLTHAATAFYNSGFETAAAIVVDGAGSYFATEKAAGFETESIYHCQYPNDFTALYKRYSDGSYNYYKNDIQEFDGSVTITKAYEAVSNYLGFGFIEAGKTMGLAAYGKDTPGDLFRNDRGDRNIFTPFYPAGAFLNVAKNFDDSWHKEPDNCPEFAKDIAYKVQKETEILVGDLIKRAVEITGEKNIVISGGYGLNVLANQYYKIRFPDLNIYVEPLSNDAGVAIGAAKLIHYEETQSTEVSPLKSLYLGNADNYSLLDAFLNQTNMTATKVEPSDVAQLLADGNIVALFQGAAEAGPRALGNRSILFDPRDPDGKAKINTVKGREWFRPFAASVIEERAADWFKFAGEPSSKYMMYAVPVKNDSIPCVTHVDGTCRIQTVTKEDNQNYYDLIKAFDDITGIPLLFNTSFNLAGDPLVDNLADAFNTLLRSEIQYLYLPEKGLLVTK